MIISAKKWRLSTYVVGVLSVQLIVFDFVYPANLFIYYLHIAAFPLIILFGLVGAFTAVFHRIGIIQFHYSSDDKRTLYYQMALFSATMAHQQRLKYSEKYYQNYGLSDPGKDA